MMIVYTLIAFGFILSSYALFVESYKPKKPLCDINSRISCTKAFSSNYGRLLFFPNSIYGIFFYLILGILLVTQIIVIAKIMVSLALLGSLALAYISYFKMKNFCVVCTAIYILNITLFFLII